ncbi:MAG: hypothetical protein IJ087_17865 [Eggerthellaceae bacterium]|nr:hypothetical protein [Eggerthellaceae bacterium]
MSEYVVCPHCHNPLSQHEWVKVVRCRDCKYFVTNIHGSYCKKSISTISDPNGFCAWGERKDA